MKNYLIIMILFLFHMDLHSQSESKDTISNVFCNCKYTLIRDQKPDTLFTSIDYPFAIYPVTKINYNYNGTISNQLKLSEVHFWSRNAKLLDTKSITDYIVFYEDTIITSDFQSYEMALILENYKKIEQYYTVKSKSDIIIFKSKKKYCKNILLIERRKIILYPE